MPEGSTVSSGRRFAADLRSLREQSGISLEEMHETTKIPRNLLSSFEETGLFENPMFNRVYLRSFVRMYAEIIGLEEGPALEALERALTGAYAGELTESPSSTVAPPAAPAEEQAEPAGTAADPAETPGADEPPSEAAQAVEPEEASPATPETTQARPPEQTAAAPPAAAKASEPRAKEAAWTTASPPPSSGSASRMKPAVSSADGGASWMGWALGAVGLLVVAAGLWFFAFRSDGEAPSTSAASAPPPDTTAAVAPEPEPPPPVDLGETVAVRVIPDGDKVQGLRATLDDDVRRPYWAEMDSSLLFSMRDQVVFEDAVDGPPGQLENIAIEIEGEPYPTTYRDADGRIVINRDTARAHLQRVRAN